MRLLLTLVVLLAHVAKADERILSFDSDITINEDASIDVTETIRVRAEGQQIRRGIYRDVPTDYVDKFGNRHEVSIVPLDVQRNGRDEDWRPTRSGDSLRVYFGNADRLLPSGEHEYTFRYRAYRMLGFFDDYDELYWNVTGFDWRFPIDRASATVRFEFGVAADALQLDAYTGAFGSRGKAFDVQRSAGPAITFTADEALSATNGLSIAVGWPKGLVAEPTGFTRAGWLVSDNRNLLFALAGWVVLLGYFLPVWYRFGRDPDEGVIVTRYEPPDAYSPASLRYVRQMYYDGKVMTAAIVNLAVKGYLTIREYDGTRTLSKTPRATGRPELAAGERELLDALFAEGNEIELDNKNHEVLGEARKAHKASLKRDYLGRYFKANGIYALPGVVIAITFTIVSLSAGFGPTPLVIAVLALTYVTLGVFSFIMRQPTVRGRRLLDEMMGFKDYLEVAEKDELNLRNPPEKTPALFERYLPYALSLGVDQAWAERFAATLASIRGPDGTAYHPAWYHGNWRSSSALASDLSGGFNTALGQSVSPPGSSSGSGGGGFSGGGGGGGGGGGW